RRRVQHERHRHPRRGRQGSRAVQGRFRCGLRESRHQVTTFTTTPILAMRDIRNSFGAVNVLKGVDLTLFPGTVTALVGDNGAGKSTLIKSIAGIYSIDGGELSWEGSKRTLRSPNDATALGIEVVYQDLALCD